jgi:LPXTG-motif cell wall-anchored protein
VPAPSQNDGENDGSLAWLIAGGIIVGLSAVGGALMLRRRRA